MAVSLPVGFGSIETVEWTEPEPGVHLYNGGVGTIRTTQFS